MQLTGSCYAFYALRKEQRVIPAKEKPPDCLVVAFFSKNFKERKYYPDEFKPKLLHLWRIDSKQTL